MKPSATISTSSERTSTDVRIGIISFPRSWLVGAEWTLLALLLVQAGARTAPRTWRVLGSDFPNYYLTARLTREHYDMTRIYEWQSLQRQKDHRLIDQQTVGMVPITAFSTLLLYPFTSLSPLTAKHCWLVANFGLLLATLWLLRSLTTLCWRRLLLIAAISLPLRVNFLLGQYYVLLLFLLTLACYLYLRQRRLTAGLLVGFAAGLKIFPILYLLFFLRKKDWRAFTGGVIASVSCLAVSVLVFGWGLNPTYITQVLPATFRGEGLAPYNLQAASLSALLHRLFVFEPQLNPHPALNLPWIFAVLHPFLLMAIAAPAILLVVPDEYSPNRVQLEWSAILVASLAISTSPASYLFTLAILHTALLLGLLHEREKYSWAAFLFLLYVAVGILGGKSDSPEGWIALIAVPRLLALIMLAGFSYLVLFWWEPRGKSGPGRNLWAIGMLALLVINIATTLRHQHGLYDDYRWRISEPANVLSATNPAVQSEGLSFIALLSDGYHLATTSGDTTSFSDKRDGDYLAVTAANGDQWAEHVGKESTIRQIPARGAASWQGELPVASHDGRWLAFLREDHGTARLWARALGPSGAEKLITGPEFNVLEMSFLPDGNLVFAADAAKHLSLFIADQNGNIRSLETENARYPSVSPDGHWLVYSQLQGGNWNLWLRDMSNGETSRLTNAECNETQSTWDGDSQTLIYTSDCGRGLWLPALCRRRVIR